MKQRRPTMMWDKPNTGTRPGTTARDLIAYSLLIEQRVLERKGKRKKNKEAPALYVTVPVQLEMSKSPNIGRVREE